MRALRNIATLFLMAALILPALAVFPPLTHAFDVPKSALWEVLIVLAASLAWSLPSARPAETTARLWLCLWGLWLLFLGWYLAVTNEHPEFTGPNITEFPLMFRIQNWIPKHLSFGMKLDSPLPGDWLFRSAEALAALTLGYFSWRSVEGAWTRSIPGLALALAAWWALAAAFSLRPDLASPLLLDWGGYLLVFAVVWVLGATRPVRGRILAALFFAAALNAIYGLAQSAGKDLVPWAETFDGRASGFFGNPDFLGGHLALLLPLALALALRSRVKAPLKALLWGLVWLLAAALVATQTRGAWLGAAAGCAVALLGARRVLPGVLQRHRVVLGASALALLLGLGACWAFSSTGSQDRLASTLSSDQGANRRIFLMTKTTELALAHPLLGVGPGAYRVWFPSVETKWLDPKDYASQDYILSEHGHNDFLQMAADAGWPAALLWAGLCALVLLRLWRGLAGIGEDDGLLVAGVLGALVAVRVHGLANFPFQIVPTESAAWALAALALRTLEPASPAAAPRAQGAWRWQWLLCGVVLAAALFAARDRQFVEEGLWWRGNGELQLKNAVLASPILLKASAMDRREDRIWTLHGQSHFDRGNIWEAIGSLREAHRLSPYDAQTTVRLGLALIENRLYDEAYTVLSGAAAYAPNLHELWEPLGAASFQDKKYDEAVKAYDWMLYYGLDEEAAYTNKAAALGNLGRLTEARDTLLEAEQRFPQSGLVEINLAITLYKMGLLKDAAKHWKAASVLTPSDPQVDILRRAMRL